MQLRPPATCCSRGPPTATSSSGRSGPAAWSSSSTSARTRGLSMVRYITFLCNAQHLKFSKSGSAAWRLSSTSARTRGPSTVGKLRFFCACVEQRGGGAWTDVARGRLQGTKGPGTGGGDVACCQLQWRQPAAGQAWLAVRPAGSLPPMPRRSAVKAKHFGVLRRQAWRLAMTVPFW